MQVRKFLTDPKTILAGVGMGFVIGLFLKPVGVAIAPQVDLYLSLLSLCLSPILITAIVGGIGRLLRDPTTRDMFKPMVIFYLFGLIFPCAVGILTAVILAPGTNLGPEAEQSLGRLIVDSPAVRGEPVTIMAFISKVIPRNVFEAMSQNQVMGVVFLSVALGIAMGVIGARAAEDVLAIIEAIYEAFMQLYRWAITILAFGLMCVVAGVVAQISAEVLIALARYVYMFYIGGAVLIALYVVLSWLAVRGSIVSVTGHLSNPIMLAFMANNPIVALPATLETIEKKFGVDRRLPDVVIPFGIFANQHGAIFLFSFLSIFLAQVYVIDLGFQEYAIVAIGSILAGTAAVGGGAILVPTVAPILAAVGLPTSLALVVLATTDNIIGPMRTILTLQSNITLTLMTARAGKEMQESDAESAAEPVASSPEAS